MRMDNFIGLYPFPPSRPNLTQLLSLAPRKPCLPECPLSHSLSSVLTNSEMKSHFRRRQNMISASRTPCRYSTKIVHCFSFPYLNRSPSLSRRPPRDPAAAKGKSSLSFSLSSWQQVSTARTPIVSVILRKIFKISPDQPIRSQIDSSALSL